MSTNLDFVYDAFHDLGFLRIQPHWNMGNLHHPGQSKIDPSIRAEVVGGQ